jgi:hypothetical protein
MTVMQKAFERMESKNNVGGTDYVPPTFCPRTAHTSACVSAHVERTGRAGTNEIPHERSARWEKRSDLFGQEGAHD